MPDNIVKIRINLTDDTKEMFEKIKEKYNLNTNTETMRLIIKKAYVHEFGPRDSER